MSYWADMAKIPTRQKSIILKYEYQGGNEPSLDSIGNVPFLKITWNCGFWASYWIMMHNGVAGIYYCYADVNPILVEDGRIFAKDYFRKIPEFQWLDCVQ